MVKASGNTSLYYPGMYLKKEAIEGETTKKPVATVEGEANSKIMYEELKVSAIHASISHEDQFAVAFVILETI
jgi:phosphopantetheinyl transferase (holo-ACP synthase)